MSQRSQAYVQFRKYLSNQSLRLSTSRRTVIEAVMDIDRHFHFAELEATLRKSGVHRATLYRALPLLENAGIIRKVRDDVHHWHYEHVLGHSHHDHLVCERCNRVIEFESREIEREQCRLCQTHRFRETSHSFVIRGICRKCQGRHGGPRQ
jgi:Fur family transcriptional regulator, ferric uptake regulator